MMKVASILTLTFSLAPLLVACSESSMLARSGDEGAYAEDAAGMADTGWGNESSDWDMGADDGYEPEAENDFLKLEPASTDAYVFVANPSRDTVTRISVPSLAVLTAAVGNDPVAVATTSDYSKGVTFNRGTDDISIIDAETMEVTTVDIRPNLNRMLMSPDGEWVVLFHDVDAEQDDDPIPQGAVSYDEASFVNLSTAEHHPMVVGFSASDVQFTDDSGTALMVSDAYLALVDLGSLEPEIELIQVADDLLDPTEAEEVVLAPDGSFAFVRQFAATELVLVDLGTFGLDTLPVGANPTDLDLSPDGTEAVAVARGSNELWIYDIADPFAEPGVIPFDEEEVFGSVLLSEDNQTGLLYSTATDVAHYATWDRTDDSVTVRPLDKPVSSVGINPSGGTALIFHPEQDFVDTDPGSAMYDRYGLTMIDLDDFRDKRLGLPGKPLAYDHADNGELGFLIMEDQPYLEVLHYESLLYEQEELKSDPVHVGVLDDTDWAYINQEHDLGRISFYSPDDGLHTVTGFELNEGIEVAE